jgi:hypothetical protein
MEATTSQRRAELLDRYQSLRRAGRDLAHRLVETLDRDAIHEAADRLGCLQGDTVVLDTEDTISVIMDFALYHVRQDGLNAVDRHFRNSPPAPGTDERTYLEAMLEARYRLLQADEVFSGFALTVHDVLRGEDGLLLDIAMSQSAWKGAVFAGHVLCFPDFWMTTGACLPLTPNVLGGLTRRLHRCFGRSSRVFQQLSAERAAQLASWVIRAALDAGMAQRVAYA